MDQLAPLIAASINAGTPLLLAAIGLLINERAGVLNLGAEGRCWCRQLLDLPLVMLPRVRCWAFLPASLGKPFRPGAS